MAITQVTTSNHLSEFVLYFRDRLLTLITDPISSRPADSKFVASSYPHRRTLYPLITVRDAGYTDMRRLGMQSENISTRIAIEVRVWAKSVKERDEISQEVINDLRDDQFTDSVGARQAGLYGMRIESVINVDESGEEGIKSKVITLSYMIVLGP